MDKIKHSKQYLPQTVPYIENICRKNRDSQLVVHKLILSQSSCFALFCSPVFRVWTSDLPTTPADHWSSPCQVARLAKGAFCPSPSKCAPAASSSCFPVRFPEELVAVMSRLHHLPMMVVVAEGFPIPPGVFFLASKHCLFSWTDILELHRWVKINLLGTPHHLCQSRPSLSPNATNATKVKNYQYFATNIFFKCKTWFLFASLAKKAGLIMTKLSTKGNQVFGKMNPRKQKFYHGSPPCSGRVPWDLTNHRAALRVSQPMAAWVLKYFLSETILAQGNWSRGTHFAQFLVSDFLKV